MEDPEPPPTTHADPTRNLHPEPAQPTTADGQLDAPVSAFKPQSTDGLSRWAQIRVRERESVLGMTRYPASLSGCSTGMP